VCSAKEVDGINKPGTKKEAGKNNENVIPECFWLVSFIFRMMRFPEKNILESVFLDGLE